MSRKNRPFRPERADSPILQQGNQSSLITIKAHPPHHGAPVRVGPYTILAGGTRDLLPDDLEKADELIALTEQLPKLHFGQTLTTMHAPLKDFGGVPGNWKDFLLQKVIPLLSTGKQVLVYCVGSHGRTGTLLASLIALLEADTDDPIQAVRDRHCRSAVETLEQAEGIFQLRDKAVPQRYIDEFTRKRLLMLPERRPPVCGK